MSIHVDARRLPRRAKTEFELSDKPKFPAGRPTDSIRLADEKAFLSCGEPLAYLRGQTVNFANYVKSPRC